MHGKKLKIVTERHLITCQDSMLCSLSRLSFNRHFSYAFIENFTAHFVYQTNTFPLIVCLKQVYAIDVYLQWLIGFNF